MSVYYKGVKISVKGYIEYTQKFLEDLSKSKNVKADDEFTRYIFNLTRNAT